MSLGLYPAVSLKEARERREELKKQVAAGLDPLEKKKERLMGKAGDSFEVVAREWLAAKEGTTEKHRAGITSRFTRNLFPWLGKRPIDSITADEIKAAILRVDSRAHYTAHRLLSECSPVFQYAISTGRATINRVPAANGWLSKIETAHFSAVLSPDQVGELLRAIHGYRGGLIVQCALKLSPLVFVRPGELRHAEWKDFDLDRAEWSFFVTKTKSPHIVPLSRQALEILRVVQPLTGGGRYVFPSARTPDGSRPMSNNAILGALRRLGYTGEEMTGHGFRAMARTILDERLRFRLDVIEHQLAHSVRDPLGRAYNRTTHIEERRAMMQARADYLDNLRKGVTVAGGR
jgi:integrase